MRLPRFHGHVGAVHAVVFHPREPVLASGGADKTLRLWNLRSGAETRAVVLGNPVESIAFIPHSTLVAVGHGWLARKAGCVLVDLDTGDATWNVDLPVTAIASSADGRRLAVAESDGPIRIWDVARREPLVQLEHGAPPGGVRSLSFHPDGRTLIGATGECATLWDVASGLVLSEVRKDDCVMSHAAFSPAGNVLATGSGSEEGSRGFVQLWSYPALTELRALGPDGWDLFGIAFSGDGRRIAAASQAGVFVWDASTGSPWGVPGRGPANPSDYTLSVALDATGARLAGGMEHGGLYVVDAQSNALEHSLSRAVSAIDFDPTGARTVLGFRDGATELFDGATGEQVAVLERRAGLVSSVAFHPTRSMAIVASGTAAYAVEFDTRSTRSVDIGRAIHSADIAFDGTLVTTSADGQVSGWDLARGERLFVLNDPASLQLVPVALDPSRRYAAAVSARTPEVIVVDLDARRIVHKLATQGPPSCVAWHPSQPFVAFGHGDGTVALWEVDASSFVLLSPGHRGWVMSVAFSADGALLASSGHNEVFVWSIRQRAIVRRHARIARHLRFAPTGELVAWDDDAWPETVEHPGDADGSR
jgi:WD40 repeat protein